MKYDQPELQEKLAGEYVLGTLSGRARRRFVKLMRRDPKLQAAVAKWEASLLPLAEGIKPIEPPAHVWQRIATRVGIRTSARPAPAASEKKSSFWESINFWRPFAISSSAVAFGLLLYLFMLGKPELPVQQLDVVAILAGKEAKPEMLITAEPHDGTLTLTVLNQQAIAADRDFELWALPTGGSPKSLGIVTSNGITRLKLPAGGLAKIPALAISLEPKGGSRTGSPTGPVLYQGFVVNVGV